MRVMVGMRYDGGDGDSDAVYTRYTPMFTYMYVPNDT